MEKYFVDYTPDIAHVDQLAITIIHVRENGETVEGLLKIFSRYWSQNLILKTPCLNLKKKRFGHNELPHGSYDNACNVLGV